MTKVILNGCSGFMGKVLTDVIAEDPAVEAVAGIDVVDRGDRPYPVFMSPSDCNVEADVIIDFSNYKAVDGILEFASLHSAYCHEHVSQSFYDFGVRFLIR